MILKKKDDLEFYQFEKLAAFPDIEHGIFTRKSGCSKSPFNELNTGCNVGDNKEDVGKNLELIKDVFKSDDFYSVNQVHGKNIVIMSGHINIDPKKKTLEDSDGIVSNIPKRNLLIRTADCQPVLMYDPIKKVVANLHSGWQGSIQNIIGQTIELMRIHFASRPRNIIAGIGPSLGPCCSEFINYKTEFPEKLWKYKKNDSNNFDLWQLSNDQLTEAGVLSENIEISNLCTKCNTDLFFSFRAEKQTGRFASVIGLI